MPFELPLFPLNTVLFPGIAFDLHIFEERYKQMISQCIEHRTPFGILLLQSGTAEEDPYSPAPSPYLIGCTAHITHVRPLSEGRLNITVVGKDRFQVVQLRHDKPYLVGMVEVLPVELGDMRSLMRQARVLRRLMSRYLDVLQGTGQQKFDTEQLPNDPAALAYLGAYILQGVAMAQKQALLAAESLSVMTDTLCITYRKEVVLLQALINPPNPDNPGTVALN